MEDNVPLPRINKWPFIIFDVLLCLTALVIGFSSQGPLSPMMFFWIITCVAAGGVVACMPFYVEFRTLAKLKEYDLGQANTENARRIEGAMLGIQEIGETMVQNSDQQKEVYAAFETLMSQLESRIGEIKNDSPVAGIDPDQLREALAEQFAEAREGFAQSIAEQVGGGDDRKHDKLNAALSKLQGLPMQVTILSELAERYQGLVAMISDTAAQMVTSAPVSPEKPSKESIEPEEAQPEEMAMPEEPLTEALEPELTEEPPEMVDEQEAELAAVEEGIAEAVEDTVEVAEIEEEVALEETPIDEDSPSEPTDLETVFEEEAAEDFGELDARFEGELADTENEEIPEDAVPEFLPEDDSDVEASASPVTEELPAESLDDLEDDDFDIAMSGAVDELDGPAEPVEKADASEATDETPAEEGEGMGFEDWDDFGEIASAESDSAESDEAASDDDSDQPELMGDMPPPKPKAKPKKKKKGDTTLIAQVLIGIGNKPYVRGVGPGLSESVGVPMEFLEIGKWQWVAPDSDEPVHVTIYKNDEVPAEGDPVEIPPGQRRSVAPKFGG